MKRLTLKNKEWACQLTTPMYDKLHDLEDIEQELGIDLATLFKAIKNGVYCKYTPNLMCAIELCFNNGMYGYNQGQFYFCDYKDNEYWLKDYGKTWALTKEELE